MLKLGKKWTQCSLMKYKSYIVLFLFRPPGSCCRVSRIWTPASGSSTLGCLWSGVSPPTSSPDSSRWRLIRPLQLKPLPPPVRYNVFCKLLLFLKEWNISRLSYEYDSEPFGKERDAAIKKLAREAGVEVTVRISHTLYDLDRWAPKPPTQHTHTHRHATVVFRCVTRSLPLQDHRAQRGSVPAHLQAVPDAHQPHGFGGAARRGHHGRRRGEMQDAAVRGPRRQFRRPHLGGARWVWRGGGVFKYIYIYIYIYIHMCVEIYINIFYYICINIFIYIFIYFVYILGL